MNFGSQELANFIVTNGRDSDIIMEHPDWEYVSSGSFRDVYLHVPTQTVYKFQSWRRDGLDDMGNEQEHANAEALRLLIWCHVYIPRTALFYVNGIDVLAMEYIRGERVSGTHMDGRQELFFKGRLGDMHSANYFVVENTIVPVDLGSPMADPLGYRPPDARLIS